MPKILIGTNGYDYDDWGTFYPHDDIGENEYLYYYAGQFPTVGINHTSYRMPTVNDIMFLLESGGQGLTFTVKAMETLTKFINPDKWQDEAKTCILVRLTGFPMQ